MYTGDLARERINDLVRDANAHRLTKGTAAGRSAERRTRVRRVGRSALWAVLWPVKH